MNTKLYSQSSYDHKANAQSNLSGRTHYVDDSTLRYFHSRIVYSDDSKGGLVFSIIESCALDSDNKSRGFRPVVFDLFGTTVLRPSMDDCFKTKTQAHKALVAFLAKFDAKAHTMESIELQKQRIAKDFEYLADDVRKASCA